MKKLLVATRSKGKLLEIQAEFKDLPFELINLSDLNFPEVEEPAMTLEGNAIIKAMTYGKRAGFLTLADDSGLEVDALGGRPGVLTARYAEGIDQDRYMKLLKEMEAVPEEKRTARFRAVVAIYDPITEKIRTCQGVYEGKITIEPTGSNGFGYDPVFFSTKLQKTSATLSITEKNSVSHRGEALRKAHEILITEF
jgi:XTP/dITP diphosphohydrolase